MTEESSPQPEENPPQRTILGIDLGTTFSLAATLADGKPLVLANALGKFLTPSVVSLTQSQEILVGEAALARMTTRPTHTVANFKRDMGTERQLSLGDRSLRPQELSSFVLQSLKKDAEEALGAAITEAVITVPAYFDHSQRTATVEAAELAGLKVQRLLNEPTAAALAYGLHQRHREFQAVVLDLGGGTFDVTVLEIIEGVIEVQASAGDTRLGGEDFVEALVEHALSALPDHREEIAASPTAWHRLHQACEEAKKRLTGNPTTAILLPQLPLPSGALVDLETEVSRELAEELWESLLQRIDHPIHRALRDAGLRPDQIDEVLLVGGATRMPCIRRLAARIFGRMPLHNLPVDEAVAMGAAVQAALTARDRQVEDLVVTDIAPFTLGISSVAVAGGQWMPGVFSPILERGTVIPASREKSFFTLSDHQEAIDIEVFQGEHSQCRDNHLIGKFTVEGIPMAPAGQEGVAVRFTYDLSGLLEVEATVLSTDRKTALMIENAPGKMSKEAMESAIETMRALKFHPREALPNTTAMDRAESAHVELTGAPRERLARAIAEFRAALESQDEDRIRGQRESLLQLISLLRGDG